MNKFQPTPFSICISVEYIHKSRIAGSEAICICNLDKYREIVLHKCHTNSHSLSNEECLLPYSPAKVGYPTAFFYRSPWYHLKLLIVRQEVCTQP